MCVTRNQKSLDNQKFTEPKENVKPKPKPKQEPWNHINTIQVMFEEDHAYVFKLDSGPHNACGNCVSQRYPYHNNVTTQVGRR
jgi:hypothetical protein